MVFGIDDIFLAVAAIASVGSAVEGAAASRKARSAQNIQKEQQNYQAARDRRQAIRNMRMAYATAQQNQENQGVFSPGGLDSIHSQGNANLHFLDQNLAYANTAGSYLDKAASHAGKASMFSSVADMMFKGYGTFTPTPPGATITPVVDMGSGFKSMLQKYQAGKNYSAMPSYMRTGGM